MENGNSQKKFNLFRMRLVWGEKSIFEQGLDKNVLRRPDHRKCIWEDF